MDPRPPSLITHLLTSTAPKSRARRYSDTDRPPTQSNFRPRPIPIPTLQKTPREVPPGSTSSPLPPVLSTPELLTSILAFLPTRDILSARRVARSWRRAILSSPDLRPHLFVRPEWSRPAEALRILEILLPGIEISGCRARTGTEAEAEAEAEVGRGQAGADGAEGRDVSVRVSLAAARGLVPEKRARARANSVFEGLRWLRDAIRNGSDVGRGSGEGGGGAGGGGGGSSRSGVYVAGPEDAIEEGGVGWGWEDLLFCQPPATKMVAYYVRGSGAGEMGEVAVEGDNGGPKPCAKITCEGGITLGFLAEVVQSLLEGKEQAEEGGLPAGVEFRGVVSTHLRRTVHWPRGKGRSVTLYN